MPAGTPRSTRRCAQIRRRRRRGAALRRVLRRSRSTRWCRGCEALERDLAGARPRLPRPSRSSTPAAQARVWHVRESALGLSMAMKGDAQGDLVRRGHGGGARAAARLHRPLPADRRAPRHASPASTPTPRSAACTCGRSSISRPPTGVAQFEAIANDVADLVLEFGGALSGEHGDGLVRGAFNEKMFGATLYQAFRDGEAHVRPAGPLQPRHASSTRRPSRRICASAPATARPSRSRFFDFGADGGLGRRRRGSAAASARAARRARARCARRTWRRATRPTRRADAPTCCVWR